MATRTVRVYDFESRQVVTIPACELAEDMMRCRVEGVEGEVFVHVADLTEGTDVFHGPLPEPMRVHIRAIQDALADVRPLTFEEWEDGFRRDTNPDAEIRIWLWIAYAYLHFTRGRDLDLEQKRDILLVMVVCASNGPEHAALTLNPRTISRKRVRQMVKELARLGPPEGQATEGGRA